MKLELLFESRNEDPERIKQMKITIPNQKDKLWVSARYFFIFGFRIGVIIHHE